MIIIKVYKDKQYLVFDFEDGKNVKYDFATKQAIGKKGKPVKDLRSQLAGIEMNQILECCVDKNYGRFLKFVQKKSSEYYECWNIGTILSKVPRYAKYEQFFSAGIEDIISERDVSFDYTINDIPKGLVKLCKERSIKLSNNFLNYYKQLPNEHLIAYKLEYLSLTDKDIYDIFTMCESQYINHQYVYKSCFNDLIKTYNYNAKSLLLYIDELKTFEAIEDVSHLIRELCDYAKMMDHISNKFERYPRRFLTTHKIACRNYNRLKQKFDEEKFKSRINKSLEYTYKDYKFIYPESTQEIKDEAVAQNNCVASYISNVVNGECHILFLRKKDTLDKSLVTIEVRNNKIVQARQKFNDMVTEEQQKVIDIWNKKFEKKEVEIAC